MSKNTQISELINYLSVDSSGNIVITGSLIGPAGSTYATQSYVTTAISNLINAAPTALDTLAELSTALNNDASFATTVTNSLASKLNLSGGSLSGNLVISQTSSEPLRIERIIGSTIYGKYSLAISGSGAFSIYDVLTDADRLIISSTGAATFSSSITATAAIFNLNTVNGGFKVSGVNATPPNLAYLANNYFAKFYTRSDANYGITIFDQSEATAIQSANLVNGDNARDLILNPYGGNLGLGTSSPSRDPSGTRSLAISGGGLLASSLDLYGNLKNYAIFTGGAGSLGFYDLTASVQRLTITSEGNVGIGTISTPSYQNYRYLQITGGATTQGGIVYLTTSDNSYIAEVGVNSNGLILSGATSNANIVFYSGGNEHMKLNTAGALQVKHTNSYATLRLGGDNGAGQGRIYLEYNGDASYIDCYGDNTYKNLQISAKNLRILTAGVERVRFTDLGNLTLNPTNVPSGLVQEVTGATPLLGLDVNFRPSDLVNTSYPGGQVRVDMRSGQAPFSFLYRPGGTSTDSVLASVREDGIRLKNGGSSLSYYEEGNWTPQLFWSNGGQYNMNASNAGRYVRVGNLVHLQFQLMWGSFSGSYGGTLRVGGIPFTAGGSCRSAGVICANNSISLGSGYTWLAMTLDPNNTSIYIIENAAGGGYNHAPTVNSSGIVYSLTITYSTT